MKSPIVHLSKDELKTVYLFKNLMSHDAPFFFPLMLYDLWEKNGKFSCYREREQKNPQLIKTPHGSSPLLMATQYNHSDSVQLKQHL